MSHSSANTIWRVVSTGTEFLSRIHPIPHAAACVWCKKVLYTVKLHIVNNIRNDDALDAKYHLS